MDLKKTGVMAAGLLACVLAGAGIEHVRLVLTTVPAEEPEPEEAAVRVQEAAPRTVVVKDEAAARDAEALRRRVAELEKALAEQPKEPEKPQMAQPDQPRRQSFAERMEQMKKENPEQYAEMQKRRDEFRQTVEQRAQDRADFLSAVDTKNMNAAQKENHEKLLATVARVNELMAQITDPGAENARDLRREMGETMASLGDLYSAERTYLLEETARAAGYQGPQTSDFVTQIQTIIDNTTAHGFGHFGRGPGGGGLPTGGAAPAPRN